MNQNLGPQFVDHLNEVPVTPRYKSGEPDREVRHVPVESLMNAWSAEYDVPAHGIASARAQRLQDYEEEYQHPGDRRGVQEALEASVAKNGVQSPLMVTMNVKHTEDTPDHSIADGSHRLLAAINTGQTHVPVVKVR